MDQSDSIASVRAQLTSLAQLAEIDKLSLWPARLVARRIHDIVTPIAYYDIRLNELVIAPESKKRFPLAVQHIHQFTKHVTCGSNLTSQGVIKLLEGIPRVHSFKYDSASFRV